MNYEKAVGKLVKDRDELLAFYDFPTEHWKHIRTTNPIESVFATAGNRTGPARFKLALLMVSKKRRQNSRVGQHVQIGRAAVDPFVVTGFRVIHVVHRLKRINHETPVKNADRLTLAPLAAHSKQGNSSGFFVQTAPGFQVEGDVLTLPYEREIFGFTDLPYRLHRYLDSYEFAHLWWGGDDNFSDTPPNALLTRFANGEPRESKLPLSAAHSHNDEQSISYVFTFEGGDALPQSAEHASCLVDNTRGCAMDACGAAEHQWQDCQADVMSRLAQSRDMPGW